MSAIGGLLGLGGGQSGTGVAGPAGTAIQNGTSADQLNQAYAGNQQALGSQQNLLNAIQGQNGLGNQSQVYNQLQGVANGTGPNPAQAQLAQATGANVANQAAMMAGQRGAAGNVGLMARQAAMQGANTQQQAAGQAATMQANQSLNALSAAGNMANTQAANQIGATAANTQAQQAEQGILQGANTANNQANVSMQSNINSANAGMANTQMQGQQGLLGGIMKGAGSALGMAGGGQVPMYADGGTTSQGFQEPQSIMAKFLKGAGGGDQSSSAPQTGSGALQAGMSSMLGGIGKAIKGKGNGPDDYLDLSDQDLGPAGPTQNLPGATNVPLPPGGVPIDNGGGGLPSPGQASSNSMGTGMGLPAIQGDAALPALARGGNVGDKLKSGGHVPGQAKVKGNSYANDTVKAVLSPGELVVDRETMADGGKAGQAARFLAAVIAAKKKGKK